MAQDFWASSGYRLLESRAEGLAITDAWLARFLEREELFPADLQEGDFIFIKNAGAYTTAYASNFNGFPLPDVATLGG